LFADHLPAETSDNIPWEGSVQVYPFAMFYGIVSSVIHSGIAHHWSDPVFATASNTVQVWDENKYVDDLRPVFLPYRLPRSVPVMDITFSTSAESVTGIRFNPSESSVLASIGSDRTFTLYDIRTGKAERRIVMKVRKCHHLSRDAAHR
jgi:WD repeat and SOF domain-containing protein 1